MARPTKIKGDLGGYEYTGEFRIPQHGEVWDNGFNVVWGGDPSEILNARKIMRKVEPEYVSDWEPTVTLGHVMKHNGVGWYEV